MVKILAVCGNGMGTSLVIKMKVQKFLDAHKIAASAESCSLGESSSRVGGADIILCSRHLEGQIRIPTGKYLIGLKNLMDEKEFGPALLEIINKHFKSEIK
jgi:galactitol-specific phosphotransferase system IIB component